MRVAVLAIASLATLASSPGQAIEPDPTKIARAAAATTAPTIDGRIDEPIWQMAAELSDFVERKPSLRAAPPDRTRVRLLVDGDALYVGIVCDDSEPTAIRARTTERDAMAVFQDDAVGVKIDPHLDRRTTYGFAVGAAGARVDYRGDGRDFHFEVDMIWDVAVALTPTGWSAEMRIPWSALDIDPTAPPDSVGFDVARDHARRNATYDWALIPPPLPPISAPYYGRIDGLRALLASAPKAHEHASWALLPWVLAGYEDPVSGPIEPLANLGLDVQADLGRGFELTLTLNTDFAQVEVDDVLTNLGRFDLFVPEKRDFFLTDGELFAAGDPGWGRLFHSRTIGLANTDAGAAEIPIVGGVKLTGRTADGLSVGLLTVTTRARDEIPWRVDSVARVQQAFGDGSNVGGIVTYRQSAELAGDHNLVFGADGHWHLPTEVPIEMSAFVAGSLDGREGAPSALDAAVFIDGRYRGELVRSRVVYGYFGPQFDSALGFIERSAVHRTAGVLEVAPRLGGVFELIEFGNVVEAAFAAPGARLLDWTNESWAELRWDSGVYVWAGGLIGAETIPSDFDLGGYTVLAGEHPQSVIQGGFGTPPTESIVFETEVGTGAHFGGTLTRLKASVAVRPGTWLRADVAFEHAWVSLPSGDFAAPTLNTRLSSGLAKDVELSFFAGWSGLEDLVSLQARLRWSFGAGNDLFAVWEMGLDDETGAATSHSAIAKLSLRWP